MHMNVSLCALIMILCSTVIENLRVNSISKTICFFVKFLLTPFHNLLFTTGSMDLTNALSLCGISNIDWLYCSYNFVVINVETGS